ncbi:acyl carrier protein [[Brevibacterium] frigoritolerans]|nr:acyl carrier protein [Peribacillus frigoritolerans]
MTTIERLTTMIVDRMSVDKNSINMESRFKEDLGADSLDVVEFIMELEDEFSVEIPDSDAETLTTVGAVVTYLDSKM